MLVAIDNGTAFPGLITGQSGVVIVIASPVKLPDLQAWTKEQGIVVSAVLCIHPQPLTGNTMKLVDLRKGWVRVQQEILAFNLRGRILVMGTTPLLNKVIFPNLPADLGACHGTIFTINVGAALKRPFVPPAHCELIPTWTLDYWNKQQYQKWMKRDVERCLRLEKPVEPLPFERGIPQWLLS